MSTLKVNNLQVGQDGTAANNYTLYQPASPDGTLKLGIGVAGNVTSNILSFNDNGSRLRINTITGSTGLNVVGADTNGFSDVEITAVGTSGSSRLYFSDTDGKAGSIIYNHSNDSLGFTTNSGSTDITVDNVGRLLIGRTTPLASSSERFAIDSGMAIIRLNSTTTGALYLRNEDTTADTRHPYLLLFDGSGNRGGIGIQNDSSNMWISGQSGISFRTGGSAPSQDERLRITQAGYVGINQSTPAQPLHIHAPSTSLAAIRLSGTASNQVEYDIRQGVVGVDNAGFSIRDISNSVTRFAIDSNGDVGIGEDSPADRLVVQKTNANGDVGIRIKNDTLTDGSASTPTTASLYLNTSTGDFNTFYIQARRYDNDTHFGYADPRSNGHTPTMVLTNEGNVYIGKTSADRTDNGFAYSVGTNNDDGTLILTNARTSGGSALEINRSNSNGNAISFFRAGTAEGTIVVDTSGTTYNTTSDIRLKTDINPISDATDKLMNMNPVTHKWKEDPDGDTVHGFIAQEMQNIAPEAVHGEPDGEMMMGMDYGRITPIIVAALQNAIKKINTLEQRISELEN